MATSAILGYGMKFETGTSGASPTYTVVADVTGITPPNPSADTVEATNMTSTSGFREYIGGLKDGGECTLEMNFIPSSSGHTGLLTALADGTEGNYRITYSDTALTAWAFKAYVTAFEVDAPIDGKITATVTFKLNGKPAFIS